MKIKSKEENIEFVVEVREVGPSVEEMAMASGRDCYTVQQFVDQYGGNFKWYETIAVLEEPKALLDHEDEDFSAPIWDLVVPWICKVGSRYPVITNEHGSFVDQGDADCNIEVI